MDKMKEIGKRWAEINGNDRRQMWWAAGLILLSSVLFISRTVIFGFDFGLIENTFFGGEVPSAAIMMDVIAGILMIVAMVRIPR